MIRFKSRTSVRVVAVVAIAGGAVLATAAVSGAAGKPEQTEFQMFPNAANVACLRASDNPAKQPTVNVEVERGDVNDTMVLHLKNFKPGLDFDLFTVEKSNQTAAGTPVSPFANFGLAWYQSDIHINDSGRATVKVKTILLDQIFGFDPAVNLTPTNTFHLGFWFNNSDDAANCGFKGSTPFNGEHAAGPLAFITRPNAQTQLGPLCTDPTTVGGTVTCNP